MRILDEPIRGRVRVLLLVLLVPLGLTFALPLWRIHLQAPQYPAGLDLLIYTHTVSGDVQEVNTLNHYIGMHAIDRASLSDLDWIPFAVGFLMLLTLRAAAIGDNRGLVDLVVLFAYFSVFSMARFAYKLYVFGHDLDPKAPFTVDPFMPALLGSKQIANFTTTSLPEPASFMLVAFGAGTLVALVWSVRLTPDPAAAG
jgi:hypothetical protein